MGESEGEGVGGGRGGGSDGGPRGPADPSRPELKEDLRQHKPVEKPCESPVEKKEENKGETPDKDSTVKTDAAKTEEEAVAAGDKAGGRAKSEKGNEKAGDEASEVWEQCGGCSERVEGLGMEVEGVVLGRCCWSLKEERHCGVCLASLTAGEELLVLQSRVFHSACLLCVECGGGGMAEGPEMLVLPRSGPAASSGGPPASPAAVSVYHAACLFCAACEVVMGPGDGLVLRPNNKGLLCQTCAPTQARERADHCAQCRLSLQPHSPLYPSINHGLLCPDCFKAHLIDAFPHLPTSS